MTGAELLRVLRDLVLGAGFEFEAPPQIVSPFSGSDYAEARIKDGVTGERTLVRVEGV